MKKKISPYCSLRTDTIAAKEAKKLLQISPGQPTKKKKIYITTNKTSIASHKQLSIPLEIQIVDTKDK